MNQQLPMQIYPYCEKKTLNTNFCVYCGHKLLKTTICPYCYTTNPINASSYAYCRHNQSSLELGNKLKDSPLFNSTFNIFRPSILVIVLLSGYSLIQMLIGSVLLLVFPSDFFIDPSNLALLSLIVLLVSNTLLITILLKLKLKSFTYHSPLPKNSQISLIFLLLLLLIVFISIIEIVVTIIDFGLNLIHVDPSIASPYDEYFSTPLNLLAFMILITIFGPILEELIFRRYTISTMLNQCQSKFLVVCTSALIFSLSHTATNLATNVRYAVLHFFATFILGIVLAIIFLRWGLKYTIIFHSFWNFYSLIVQLLINEGASQLVDLIILLCIIITILLAILFLSRFQRFLGLISEVILPSRTILLFTTLNFFLIISYVFIFPLLLLLIPSNIITVGLTFIYQTCAFLVGIILIDRENKRMNRFEINLDPLYNEISSFE